MKPKILLETDLFWEDIEKEGKEVIEKYFEVKELENTSLWDGSVLKLRDEGYAFRCSLNIAKYIGRKYEFANALKFMPYFREKLINPEVHFNSFQAIGELYYDFKYFIRPVSSFKEFAGNVYTRESYLNEFEHYKQRGADPHIICAYANPVKVLEEWRCVFVDNEYISGSKYMENGEAKVEPGVPDEVVEYAKKIAADSYFQNVFDFVVDVCTLEDRLALVEINSLECSSFYASNLDDIYSAWARSYQD